MLLPLKKLVTFILHARIKLFFSSVIALIVFHEVTFFKLSWHKLTQWHFKNGVLSANIYRLSEKSKNNL